MRRLIVLFLILLTQSMTVPPDLIDIDESLCLKWNKGYQDDSIDKATVGLRWALSYIGARSLGPDQLSVSGDIITINPHKLGFNENAVQKIKILHQKIMDSEEYRNNKSVDLGRYISLLIGSPKHYYAITAVPEHLDGLLANYTLLPEKGYVNHSNVSLKHRIIRFSEQNKLKQLFIATEVDPVTGRIQEYETIELMENAQVRFGIFDAEGNRMDNADPSVTNAGKPAKCMWCHESTISQMFNAQEDVPSYLTYSVLQSKLIAYNKSLTEQKSKITSGVDYAKLQDHTFTELLYISFMEPSAERLSTEWGIPLPQVQELLLGLPTHVYQEFPFLGNLYHRNDVEKLAPFKGLEVSGSVREKSSEVNHIND